MNALPDMTLFKAAVQQHSRQFQVAFTALTFGPILVPVAGGFIGLVIKDLFTAWLGEVGREFVPSIAFLLALPVGLPAWLSVRTRLHGLYRKFPALICPHCDQNLAGGSDVVRLTGNCPNCGRRAIADVDFKKQIQVKRTRFASVAAFNVAHADLLRRRNLRGIATLTLFSLLCIGPLVVLAPWVPVFWEPARPLLALAVFVVCACCLLAIVWREAIHQQKSLPCPLCARPLFESRPIVVATGNCPHCGRRIIKDEKHGT